MITSEATAPDKFATAHTIPIGQLYVEACALGEMHKGSQGRAFLVARFIIQERKTSNAHSKDKR